MKKMILTSALVLPLLASAHSGHGPVDNGIAHYLLSPLHLVGVIVGVAIAVGLYKYFSARKRTNA